MAKPPFFGQRKKIVFVCLCVGFVAISAGIVIIFFAHQRESGRARSKGRPSAQVHIVEYSDFECAACAVGAAYIGEYVKKYPSRIYVMAKHFPLEYHRHAFTASQYAECAARQGKFWPFHDEVFRRRSSWRRVMNIDGALREIALGVGMNLTRLNACLEDARARQAILADIVEGRAQGVTATPTYFVNGKKIEGVKGLKEALAEMFPEIP